MNEPSEELDFFAHGVIGVAIEVHRLLGPGSLESVYEEALAIEMNLREIPFQGHPVALGLAAQDGKAGRGKRGADVAFAVHEDARGREACLPAAARRGAWAPPRRTPRDEVSAATRSNGAAPVGNGPWPGAYSPPKPVAPGVRECRLDRDRVRVHADQLARPEQAGRDRQHSRPAAHVEQPGVPIRRGAAGQVDHRPPSARCRPGEAGGRMEAAVPNAIPGSMAMTTSPGARRWRRQVGLDHDPPADPHHADVALPGARPIRVVDHGRDERADLAQAEGREVAERSIRRGDRFPDGPGIARREVRLHRRRAGQR